MEELHFLSCVQFCWDATKNKKGGEVVSYVNEGGQVQYLNRGHGLCMGVLATNLVSGVSTIKMTNLIIFLCFTLSSNSRAKMLPWSGNNMNSGQFFVL